MTGMDLPAARRQPSMFPLALPVFFASGFAALLYQVIWQRLLVIFSGADVYSATLIVAAFMAGLGVGSVAGGHVADRVSARGSVLLFCAAELAVGLFGAGSGALFQDVLYARLGPADLPAAVMGGALFASLLWPTFFMGASLPLLARALAGDVTLAPARIGILYGVNTLGAAVGAFAATWWLLPTMGLDHSLRAAATINLLCAAIFAPVAFRLVRDDVRTDSGRPATVTARPPAAVDDPIPFLLWALIYACSGFIALSFEIVWFRMLGVMVKSTAFTFGTLLGLYLSGLGIGAVAGSALARRVARPRETFFLLQSGVGLCGGALLLVVLVLSARSTALNDYFSSYEPLDVRQHVAALVGTGSSADGSNPSLFAQLYLLLPALLVLPSTVLMGASFPLLQRVVQTSAAYVGRRVGGLLLANVAGSMAGAMLTGWMLLEALGTAGVLRLLVMLTALFALTGTVADRRSRRGEVVALSPRAHRRPVLLLAAVLLLATALPNAATLWSRLHGADAGQLIFGEDGSGVSAVKPNRDDPSALTVFVNGVGQSTIPYTTIHTALGALPAFVHGAPKQAMVIGLGSGATVYGMAGHPAIERLACVEIIGPQLPTLLRLNRLSGSGPWPSYPALRQLLRDGRIDHIFGDGRRYLLRGGRRFDLIEADALRPGSAYAGSLYSEEYFRLLLDRLTPGGIAATWVPTDRVRDTFVKVFPYAVRLNGLLLGSRTPITIDRAAIDAQLARPEIRKHYADAGIDIVVLVQRYLASPVVYGADYPRARLTDINTDLDPRDEFDLGLRQDFSRLAIDGR